MSAQPPVCRSLLRAVLAAAVVVGAARASGGTIPPTFTDVAIYWAGFSGDQMRPTPVSTPGGAFGFVAFDRALEQVYFEIETWQLSSAPTLIQMHDVGLSPAVSPAVPGLDYVFPAGAPTGGVVSYIRPMSLALWSSTLEYYFGPYLQIHTLQHPGGELRGQIVPEPATAALLGLGLAALALRAARADRHTRA